VGLLVKLLAEEARKVKMRKRIWMCLPLYVWYIITAMLQMDRKLVSWLAEAIFSRLSKAKLVINAKERFSKKRSLALFVGASQLVYFISTLSF